MQRVQWQLIFQAEHLEYKMLKRTLMITSNSQNQQVKQDKHIQPFRGMTRTEVQCLNNVKIAVSIVCHSMRQNQVCYEVKCYKTLRVMCQMFLTVLTPTFSMLPQRWEEQVPPKSWNLPMKTIWSLNQKDHNMNIHCQCCTTCVLTTKCTANLKGMIFAACEDSPSLRVQHCYWLLVGSGCFQLDAAQIFITAFTIHNGFPVND